MPRISPRDYSSAIRYGLIRLPKSYSLSPPTKTPTAPSLHMLQLVSVTRSYQLALQELRWIKKQLPDSQWLSAITSRAVRRVPLQYLLGDQPFLSLDIKCDSRALIPRWETESWIARLIKLINEKYQDEKAGSYTDSFTVVDACTGTGCIALAIAAELKVRNNSISASASSNMDKKKFSDLKIWGLDVDEKCISLATENKERNRSLIEKNDVCSIINFLKFDLLKDEYFTNDINDGAEKIDLLVSNPPYITIQDYENTALDKSVKVYEPRLALVGDLEFYDALINKFIKNKPNTNLTPDAFVFEVGYWHQIKHVADKLQILRNDDDTENNNWKVGYWRDENSKERCVVGWRNGSKFEFLEDMVHGMLVE